MNFLLMNKDIPVLEFSYDEDIHSIEKIIKLIHPEYAPLGIMEYKTGISRKSFNYWWKDRAIPASRSMFKDILDDMEITSSVELLEKCYGLSLSDQYWIKEKNSPILYEEINFFENDFSEDMGKLLMGQIEYSSELDIFSPDNSSDGNLRKKWKIIDGKRCLIKSGNSYNNQEPFNELIATKLYERILEQKEFVPYSLIKENGRYYSCCETMVNTHQELVTAFYIDKTKKLKGSDSLYEHYISVCDSLGIKNAKQQIDKMIVCDYIIANYDRHYRNFGAIRNIDNLEWEGIAPIYDSGSSLWATTQAVGTTYKCKPFKSGPEAQLQLVNDLSWLDINKLQGFENDVTEVLLLNELMTSERIINISNQVKLRLNKVINRKRLLEK